MKFVAERLLLLLGRCWPFTTFLKSFPSSLWLLSPSLKKYRSSPTPRRLWRAALLHAAPASALLLRPLCRPSAPHRREQLTAPPYRRYTGHTAPNRWESDTAHKSASTPGRRSSRPLSLSSCSRPPVTKIKDLGLLCATNGGRLTAPAASPGRRDKFSVKPYKRGGRRRRPRRGAAVTA